MTLMLNTRSMPRKHRGYARAKFLQLLKSIDPQTQYIQRDEDFGSPVEADRDEPVVLEFYADDSMLSYYEVLETISASARGNSVLLKLLVRPKSFLDDSVVCDSDDAASLLPQRESMRRMNRYEERNCLVGFGPLIRFLTKHLGEPISFVKEEFARRLPQRFAARQHVLDTFERLVCETVFFGENGAVHDFTRSASYNQLIAGRFYVHPEHGTLEQVKPQPKDEPKRRFEQVDISDLSKLVKVDGLWYVVEFAPVTAPEPRSAEDYASLPKDIFLDVLAYVRKPLRYVDDGKDCFEVEWGSKVYAVSKRSAGKDLLRRHGLRG